MKLLLFAAAALLLPVVVRAHVGNPDVYYDGAAGTYRLFVTVRPPLVIPGVAEIEVRTHDARVDRLHAVPIPLDPKYVNLSPVPDLLVRSPQDPQFFTGSLWIMAAGSWQVRISAEGPDGRAIMAVPVPSVAHSTKKMQLALGVVLTILMLLLVAGLVLITGASVREAKLDRGLTPSDETKRRARRAMAGAFVIVVAVLASGWWWWHSSEEQYRRNIFETFPIHAAISPDGHLLLQLQNPAPPASGNPTARFIPAFFARTIDDLVPDHNHLMHLYAIRQPGLDVVYHLHPQVAGAGQFDLPLPRVLPGRYRLYADIVHANGFPETPVAEIEIPAGLPARPLEGDDATGSALPLQSDGADTTTFTLPDGYRMQWLRPATLLRTGAAQDFRFALLDPNGKPVHDMQLYMGMPGHAAFVKADGSAFAHIHPSGSVSMASLMMAQQQLTGMDDMAMPDMLPPAHISNEVGFPYGFPSPGRYRVFVQMKRAGTIETGIFDLTVAP